MTGRRVDVAIIGDGPAGSALAAECARRDLDALLVGADDDWSATYGTWVDDLAGAAGRLAGGSADDWFADTVPTISVHTANGSQSLTRPYGVIANERFRADLRRRVDHLSGVVDRVEHGSAWHHVILDDERIVHCRLVVDATGWPSRFGGGTDRDRREPAWQTAFGVVLPEPPDGDLGRPTLMDFRVASSYDSLGGARESTIGPVGVTTFGYALPVADGWMVEETVLAARPLVEPVSLVARLAARLGRHPDDLLAEAVRTEFVRIPMGAPVPARDRHVVAFGAAAGYVHPATGYSVAASVRLADPVATAIAGAIDRDPSAGRVLDAAAVWNAVWPVSMRRTRVLHDYGLDALLGLDAGGVGAFFASFFDLPVERWSTYLRIDAPPREVVAVMTRLFKSAPWSLRRRLAVSNPLWMARLVRP